ncbi:hypothetical protein L227DRAFT_44803 [Lentinus tigrinus ALCF2SS1-6]|uniref:Secreted protein n=1 Tax=Lentinus tigrinus ALCF2SS1-6 TaxID=1328759 RepID=A0A5C2SFL2_9APHY|nr:hypothetical protein L227DRAFT_44803 [Lentinus tigrinus ALCF2SS1-6]
MCSSVTVLLSLAGACLFSYSVEVVPVVGHTICSCCIQCLLKPLTLLRHTLQPANANQVLCLWEGKRMTDTSIPVLCCFIICSVA